MRCARKPTSVKQPKWHSLSTSSTACWRWDAQATSASYETTRTRDHCVHRLIHATRSQIEEFEPSRRMVGQGFQVGEAVAGVDMHMPADQRAAKGRRLRIAVYRKH